MCEKTILESGAWTVPADVSSVDVLVVGAGGGGGGYGWPGGAGGAYGSGGGGGGGQARVFTDISVTTGQTADITIGAGGSGGGQASDGSPGEESTFLYGGTPHTAAGGAGGLRGILGTTSSESGGSGGSGGTDSPSGTGGGNGGKGGNWSTSGAAGLDGPTPTDGLFSGNSTAYGGGGGGGSGYPTDGSPLLAGGAGGDGGGGSGGDGGTRSNTPNLSSPGIDGRGGGGGGGSQGTRDDGNTFSGARGGTGVIVVRTTTLELCDGSAFAGGDGSGSDPYQISNATQLAALANDSACYSSNFIQTSDIALSGTWTPIGDSTNTFQGTYDGNGKSITGLVLPQQDFSGLFGVTNGATITNLLVSGSTAAGTPALEYVGVLIGLATNSDVVNIDVQADIEALNYVGGVIGELAGGTVADVNATGDVTGLDFAPGRYGISIGGLIGRIDTSTATISNCSTATGTIRGDTKVGGVVGSIASGSGDGDIIVTSCSSRSSVTATARLFFARAGGFIGSLGRTDGRVTVTGSSVSGSVTSASGYLVGGFAGEVAGTYTIEDSNANGDVTGDGQVGGFVGGATGPHVSSVIRRASASGTVTGASRSVGGFLGYSRVGSGERLVISDSHATGDVSAPGSPATGGFAGELTRADITDCYASGSTTGSEYVGGFVGLTLSDTTIERSYATGATDGNGSVGGFVGTHESTGPLVDIYATGRVRGGVTSSRSGWSTGGLAGNLLNAGSIVRSFSTGDVSGIYRVGGLVGELDGPSSGTPVSVTDSFATGDVYASGLVSGSVSEGSVGGVVGINRDLVSITNTYVSGAVSATVGSRFVGAITGTDFTAMTASAVYWDSQTSGVGKAAGTADNTGADVTGATSLTTAQMRASSSFSDWNFSTVWGYQCGVSNSPELRWANSQATSLAAGACATPSPDRGGGSGPQPGPSNSGTSAPATSEPADVTGEVPPAPQPSGSASMLINGQPIAVQEQQLRRGQGLRLSAGPVSMSLRSTTPSGRAVPLAPDGGLLLARSGELPITASGLAAGSEVTMTLFSEPIFLGTTTADQNGDVASTVGIPSTTPLGSHTLHMEGATNTGEAFALDIGVSVTTPAKALGANPILVVKDKSAKGTRALRIRVKGVQARCKVTFTAGKKETKVRATKHGTAKAHLRLKRESTRTIKVSARVTGKGCARVQVSQRT